MYICLLHQNLVLCQQVTIAVMQLGHTLIHFLSLNRIERGLVGMPGPRTSKSATFL